MFALARSCPNDSNTWYLVQKACPLKSHSSANWVEERKSCIWALSALQERAPRPTCTAQPCHQSRLDRGSCASIYKLLPKGFHCLYTAKTSFSRWVVAKILLSSLSTLWKSCFRLWEVLLDIWHSLCLLRGGVCWTTWAGTREDFMFCKSDLVVTTR